MLSGRYQIHTGMQHAVLWKQQVNGLPKNESTIAEYLRPLGYATHAIGKWVRNVVSTPRLRDHCVFYSGSQTVYCVPRWHLNLIPCCSTLA